MIEDTELVSSTRLEESSEDFRGKIGQSGQRERKGWGRARAPLHQRRRLPVSSRSHPSFQSSTVADGSQTLGMNEGAGYRLKQSPSLSAPFSLGSPFARCPRPASIAPQTLLVPASEFLVPGSTGVDSGHRECRGTQNIA